MAKFFNIASNLESRAEIGTLTPEFPVFSLVCVS